MPATEAPLQNLQPFVADLFHYHRRKTRTVMVGKVGVGGDNPIRVQSMTTTPTTDVEGTVAQSIRMIEAGCEIVRITAPKLADARALGPIRTQLNAQGFAHIPLVADIHFNPECAMEAANHVEKIRVNPGNYADSKAFKIKEYTDTEYEAELARLEERFTPLALKCKKLRRAMRIGSNHGSLSDRIMNRFGDSPEGMVESALEFVRICRKHDYHELILSMKSSNPKVMIAAYRLLATRMNEEGFDYPFHLGVTEAGYGEDGRIKSAIGIGSLLNDGIGDTIRVSLTEDPEFEMPVAESIAVPYQPKAVTPAEAGAHVNGNVDSRLRGNDNLIHVDNFYHFARRPTRELKIGPIKVGGENATRVISDFSKWFATAPNPAEAARNLLRLLEHQLGTGKDMVPEIIEWTVPDAAALEALRTARKELGQETSRLAFLGRFQTLALAKEGLPLVHAAHLVVSHDIPAPEYLQQFREFVRLAKAAHVPVLVESGPCQGGELEPGKNLMTGIELCESEGHKDLLVALNLPTVQSLIANAREAVALMRQKGMDYPFHLRLPAGKPRLAHEKDFDRLRIDASIAFGALLCDGIGDSVQAGLGVDPNQDLELLYNVLQGAAVRITKTEFVSCPSCGRTLFDLQTTTERIKSQTGHLKGVKIAIMGCIVNGPGEMADADFGYVGGAPGRINLYVGKDCVEKGIPFDQADQRLVDLIKIHGKWMEPRPLA